MVHFRGNFYMTVHTFYGGIFTRFIVESQRLFMLKLSHFSVANSVILHTLYLLNFTTFRLYSALAKLELKIGCPVMVLKNLDAANGVCNGSRGILTRYGNRVLEIRLLTGDHAGETVFIPRVANQPGEDENAFKFTRRQFPIRVCFFMTINKSQGQSVKFVRLDLRSLVFTYRQFYVAVSRVTSVKNIKAI